MNQLEKIHRSVTSLELSKYDLKLSFKDLKLFSLGQKKTEKGHDKSIQICKRLLKKSNKLLSVFTGVAREEKDSKCS